MPQNDQRLRPVQQNPLGGSSGDATLEFYEALNDPRRWVVKNNVPIFKPHQRTDPNTKQLIQVDLPKLHRIAANLQRMERQGGVPIRMTLGHTEPGKPETQQPPIGGYYRNARVAPFGPKGEPAVVVDEWLDPQYAQVRKNYPYRSAEYYDDAEQITGVALLTRDPYLDLGVVAYSNDSGMVAYTKDSNSPQPVRYERGVPRHPVMYSLVIGEIPVNPTTVPNTTPPPVLPTNQPNPTPYAGPWPGPAHRRANIGHNHPSGGAIYASGMYGPSDGMGGPSGGGMGGPPMMGGPSGGMGGPPPSGGMGGPPPSGGMSGASGGGGPMSALRDCLMQAVQIIQSMDGGASGGMGGPSGGPPPVGNAPTGPFPPDEEPTMSSRYANGGGRSRPQPRPQQRPQQGRYQYQGEPQPATYPRTISGLPVGYQMELDKRDAKIRDLEKQMQVVFYERDEADTEACAAEISGLIARGYQVGEYEFQELKAKPKEQRPVYLQHIMAKYQRIGTEALPPILGDPSPSGPNPDANRPASREEMEEALKMSAGRGQEVYLQALQYIRGGGRGGQVQYGHPGMESLVNPYEPSENGNGY